MCSKHRDAHAFQGTTLWSRRSQNETRKRLIWWGPVLTHGLLAGPLTLAVCCAPGLPPELEYWFFGWNHSFLHSTTSLRMLLPGPRAPPTCTTSKAAPEKPKPASPERSPVKLRSSQRSSRHRGSRPRHRHSRSHRQKHRHNHRRRSPSHRRHHRRSQRSRSRRRARSRSRRRSGSLAWGGVVQLVVITQCVSVYSRMFQVVKQQECSGARLFGITCIRTTVQLRDCIFG